MRLLADGDLPCISLHQPWASALMAGLKGGETRGFRLPGTFLCAPMLLHAAKVKIPLDAFEGPLRDLILRKWGTLGYDALPRGAYLGIVRFSSDDPTESGPDDKLDELLGDWSPGRRVWRCDQRRPFSFPVAARGRQRFWYQTLSPIFEKLNPL